MPSMVVVERRLSKVVNISLFKRYDISELEFISEEGVQKWTSGVFQ